MTTELKGLGALDDLGRQFARLEESPPPRRPRRTIAAVAALVLAIVAASFTPPGRAVAGKIGELVGIGDEPTDVGGTSVVIGTGKGPTGNPYEIFAFTDLPMTVASEGPQPTCIGLNVPESDTGIQEASCLTDDQKPFLKREVVNPIAQPAPSRLGPDQTVIQGLARGDVAAVELEHDSAAIPIDFFPLDEELRARIGSNEDVGFFFSLIPNGLLYGGEARPDVEESFAHLRLRALGENGEVLLDKRYTDLSLPTWWEAVAGGFPNEAGAVPVPPPARERKPPAD